jgi:hypothetical protein
LVARHDALQSELTELREEAKELQDWNQAELNSMNGLDAAGKKHMTRKDKRIAHFQGLVDAAKEDDAISNTKETRDQITYWKTHLDAAKDDKAAYKDDEDDVAEWEKTKVELTDAIRLLSSICKWSEKSRYGVIVATNIILAGMPVPEWL